MEGEEGAAGTIHIGNNGWVRKTLKRKARGKTRNAKNQFIIQKWSHEYLVPSNGFTILYTPAARHSNNSKFSYSMERIDNKKQIMKLTKEDADLADEIVKYHRAAIRKGYFMNDIELYRQPDGRVAVLDFDKVGNIDGNTVTYPPSTRSANIKDALDQYYLTPDLAKRILQKNSASR